VVFSAMLQPAGANGNIKYFRNWAKHIK
jgi:hypothetical protein